MSCHSNISNSLLVFLLSMQQTACLCAFWKGGGCWSQITTAKKLGCLTIYKFLLRVTSLANAKKREAVSFFELFPKRRVSLPNSHALGLIIYVDTKTKCRHLKKLTCKGSLRQVFIRVYRLEIQSVGIFYTQLCVLLPLSPSLWFKSPPPFNVWISILYTRLLVYSV